MFHDSVASIVQSFVVNGIGAMVSKSDVLEGFVALASPFLRTGINDPTHVIDLDLSFPALIFHMIPSPAVPFPFRPFFHNN